MDKNERVKDDNLPRNKSLDEKQAANQAENNKPPDDRSMTALIREKLADENFLERLAEAAMGRRSSDSKDMDENIRDSQLEAWASESKMKIDAAPENPDHWFHYGVAVASLGRRQEAEKAFEKAVEIGPRHVKSWYWLGMIRNNMDRDSDALEAHEKATELAPDWARPWCDKALSLAKLGRYEEAGEAFDESLKLDDKDVFAWANKGYMLREAGRLEEALGAFTKAIELDKDSADAWDSKGDVLRTMGRLDEAIQCFEEAVRLKPDYAGGWHNLGHAFFIQGNYAESIQPLDKAIALSYPEPKSHAMKVVALGQLGQIEKAIEVCDDGLNKWDDVELFRLKSGLLGMLKRHEECLAVVNQAIEIGFTDDEMLIWKGATLIELKHFEEALTQFNEVLERSSGNLQARCGRAYCLCKTGKLGEGKQEIDQVVEGNPTDARSWYTRSHIYVSLEDKVEMLASLEKAIQLEPELAQEAPGEDEFGSYRDLPEFEAIVKK